MLKFTIFDIIVLSIITLTSLLGVSRGAIKTLFSSAAFFSSILGAYIIYPLIHRIIDKYVYNDIGKVVFSAILAYVISLIVISYLKSKLLSFIKTEGIIDRLFGFVVGYIRGVIISLGIFTVLIVFTSSSFNNAENAADVLTNISSEKYPEWLEMSVTTKYLDRAYRNIISMIPTDFLQSIVLPQKFQEDSDYNSDV